MLANLVAHSLPFRFISLRSEMRGRGYPIVLDDCQKGWGWPSLLMLKRIGHQVVRVIKYLNPKPAEQPFVMGLEWMRMGLILLAGSGYIHSYRWWDGVLNGFLSKGFYVKRILLRNPGRQNSCQACYSICNYTNTINRFNQSGHTVHFNNSFVRHIQYIDASTFCLTIELWSWNPLNKINKINLFNRT